MSDLRDLTLVLPHFCNLGMLAEHQRIWMTYPSELRERLHVIIADDCSPKGFRPVRKALTVTGLASLHVFRLLEKKRWNWLACRNLGMSHAPSEWVLLTDIDHALPVETLQRLLSIELDPKNVYRLQRVDAPHPWPFTLADCAVRDKKRFHPNTWLMTRAMYDRIGGYDERLSGCYGTDGEFKDRVNATARAVVALPDVLIRYGREILPDASTPPTVFTRKNDPENDADLKQRREARALIPAWRPLRGLTRWEAIATEQEVTV